MLTEGYTTSTLPLPNSRSTDTNFGLKRDQHIATMLRC